MFAGAFVAGFSFLGIPASGGRVMFFIAGVFVFALGIAVRRRIPRSVPRTFVESVPPPSDTKQEIS